MQHPAQHPAQTSLAACPDALNAVQVTKFESGKDTLASLRHYNHSQPHWLFLVIVAIPHHLSTCWQASESWLPAGAAAASASANKVTHECCCRAAAFIPLTGEDNDAHPPTQ
jgi:hypothetical protein